MAKNITRADIVAAIYTKVGLSHLDSFCIIEDIVSENREDGTLILCDLFGGSPFLTSAKLLKENSDHMELVTGVNLGMLLELMANIETASITELKDIALSSGKEGIIDIKERLGK